MISQLINMSLVNNIVLSCSAFILSNKINLFAKSTTTYEGICCLIVRMKDNLFIKIYYLHNY